MSEHDRRRKPGHLQRSGRVFSSHRLRPRPSAMTSTSAWQPRRAEDSCRAGSGGCEPPGAQLQPVLLERSHACPFCCLAGRFALPLELGDGGRRGMPTEHQGQATEPTKSAMDQDCRVGSARVPGWLVSACGWGSGMPGAVRPDPSTLGVVGDRGSRHERCLQLVPGCSSGLVACPPVEGEVDGGGVVAALGPGPLLAFGINGLGGADLAEQLVGAALLQQRQ
jgi:hypothetical protein